MRLAAFWLFHHLACHLEPFTVYQSLKNYFVFFVAYKERTAPAFT